MTALPVTGEQVEQLVDRLAMPGDVLARRAFIPRVEQPAHLGDEVDVVGELSLDTRGEPRGAGAQIGIQTAGGLSEGDVIVQVVGELGQGRAHPATPELAEPERHRERVIKGSHRLTQLPPVGPNFLQVCRDLAVHAASLRRWSPHGPGPEPCALGPVARPWVRGDNEGFPPPRIAARGSPRGLVCRRSLVFGVSLCSGTALVQAR